MRQRQQGTRTNTRSRPGEPQSRSRSQQARQARPRQRPAEHDTVDRGAGRRGSYGPGPGEGRGSSRYGPSGYGLRDRDETDEGRPSGRRAAPRRAKRREADPADGGIIRRTLTHTVTIMTGVLVVLLAAVYYLSPGGGKPPPGYEDMSANQLMMMMNSSQMTPFEAEQIANAKQRAYEAQVKAERLAREKAKRDAKVRAQLRARAKASKAAAALARKNNTTPAQNKALGKHMSSLKGWSGCWPSLETMWTHESGWNQRADNPYSDAYGIPQALPGSKMASAGPNWQTSAATQIAWGLGYIKARYGDPCKAWSFWQAHHWY